MRRLRTILLGGLLTALLVGANSTQVFAQEGKKVTIKTIDGVRLEGTWYSRNRTSPVVLMLHGIGSDSSNNGWQALAKTLHKKDFAVLSLDLRGHGESTNIDKEAFWSSNNSRLFQRLKGAPESKISYKQFRSDYFPYIVNDIAAAKAWLDKRSDEGWCNSASLLLVGEKTGATLGARWLLSEWNRYPGQKIRDALGLPAVIPDFNHAMGQYVIGCVWLSMRTSHIPKKPPTKKEFNECIWFLSKAVKKKATPMLFLYNAKVKVDKVVSERYAKTLGGSNKKSKNQFIAALGIEGAKDLQGSELLLKTGLTDKVTNYLKAVVDNKTNTPKAWSLNQKQYFWVYGPNPSQWIQANDLNSEKFKYNSFRGFPTR
ncbi:MAG: alpha/beta hydrolase [Gemmataceae bacterium]